MDNRINNRIYYNHEKVHNAIFMNPFKQITTFLEIFTWFWITLCHTFQLFSCSILLHIYFIFNTLLNVYHQGYVVCTLFFLIFFFFLLVHLLQFNIQIRRFEKLQNFIKQNIPRNLQEAIQKTILSKTFTCLLNSKSKFGLCHTSFRDLWRFLGGF